MTNFGMGLTSVGFFAFQVYKREACPWVPKMRKLSPEAERWHFERVKKSHDARDLLLFLRYKTLTDLAFLAQEVLGYPDCIDPAHYYLDHRFENPRKKHSLLVGGRQIYKSSYANYARSIQDILRNPDVTIEEIGSDEDLAKGHVEEIAAKIESERFRAIWGDWRGNPWSTSEGKLSVNRRKWKTKDPTVSVGAPDKEKTSKHPMIVNADDLEAEVSSRSAVRRENVMEYFKNIWGRVRHGGEVRVINAPWRHDFLIFGLLMNPSNRLHEFFDIICLPIGEYGEPSVIMPKVFTPEHIAMLEELWGKPAVMCQLYLWPMGDEAETFDMLRLEANTVDELPKLLNTWCIIDPSKSKKYSHDPMGAVVLGKDTEGLLYILDVDEIHAKPWECCRRVLKMADRWKCKGISPELAPGVTDYKELLEEFMDAPGYSGRQFVVKAVKAGNREKNAERIDPLIALWDRGRLRLYSQMPRRAWKMLVRQMRGYPVGKDDILDCTGYHNDVRRFRRPGKEPRARTEGEEEQAKMRRNVKKFAEEQLGTRRGRRRMEIVGGLPIHMG
jgi:hypothetical protein